MIGKIGYVRQAKVDAERTRHLAVIYQRHAHSHNCCADRRGIRGCYNPLLTIKHPHKPLAAKGLGVEILDHALIIMRFAAVKSIIGFNKVHLLEQLYQNIAFIFIKFIRGSAHRIRQHARAKLKHIEIHIHLFRHSLAHCLGHGVKLLHFRVV